MQMALSRHDATAVIRLLRRGLRSLTQELIGQMTGLSQSTISRIESGLKIPDEAQTRHILTALGAPQTTQPTPQDRPALPLETAEPELFIESSRDVVNMAAHLWKADLFDLSGHWLIDPKTNLSTPLLRWLLAPPAVLESTSAGQENVTDGDVYAINRACDMFERLDHEFGGGHARTAAVQYLASEVAPLLQGRYTPEVGQKLFGASARFAAKVGAMTYDAGQHALGRRYFLLGLSFSHLAGDRLLGAKSLALLSHQANFLGEYRTALDFARTAKTGATQATPAVRAMLAAMEARALASLGDERACTRSLTEMEEAFGQIDLAIEPPWMTYFDESELSDELAHCLHDLGHGDNAINHAQHSLAQAPEGARRSRSFAGLIQASSHLRAQDTDLEAACAVARDTITMAGTLRSIRVRTYLERFRGDLAPYARSKYVQNFNEFLADAPLTRR